jgi:cytochrome P450
LFPPVWGFGRQAIEDVEIGGYPLAKDSTFSVLTWLVHRDKRWWGDDALEFRPERFETEDYPRYAYIPFGGGPRVCIGNSFAMMEARLLLAAIAQRAQLRLSPGQKVTPQPLTTLRPKGGLPMRLEQRS